MYAKLIVNNGSIVVKYSKNGRMRFPTQITISKEKSSTGKYKDWDYKNNLIRNTVDNYAQSNEILSQILKRANDIISDHLKNDIKIGAEELKTELSDTRKEIQDIHSALLLDWYKLFFDRMYKILFENPNHSKASFKNYTTFKNTLIDYEFDKQQQLKVADIINFDWCVDFTGWMQRKRPASATKNGITHSYKTKGKSSVNTLGKRYQVLKSFCAYLKENKVITDYDIILKYVRNEIKEQPSIKTTLTIEEINLLAKYLKIETLLKYPRRLPIPYRDIHLSIC